MIAQEDSQDGQVVKELDIGLTIDIFESDRSIDKLLSITNLQIQKWQNNLNGLPQSLSVISNEYEDLLQKVENGCN